MKVIDLLNKIANGEDVPNEIIYHGNYYYNVGNKEQAYYENTELEDNLFLCAVYNEGHLNDEVEIIEDTPKEDKKIEKIEERIDTGLVGTEILDEFKVAGAINKQASYTFDIAKKLNEIIDKVNKL